MREAADGIRILHPLFRNSVGPSVAIRARNITFEPCPKCHAVLLVRAWHSRLPNCQQGPWTHAFRGHINDKTYVVALWNNPSARCLPGHWRELRRMACAPDAPRNTPSRFLAWMVNWFKENEPECERVISYQDTEVHSGTIYKAAGWTADAETAARTRDRTKSRTGTNRLYRSNANGAEPDRASKVRWSKVI